MLDTQSPRGRFGRAGAPPRRPPSGEGRLRATRVSTSRASSAASPLGEPQRGVGRTSLPSWPMTMVRYISPFPPPFFFKKNFCRWSTADSASARRGKSAGRLRNCPYFVALFSCRAETCPLVAVRRPTLMDAAHPTRTGHRPRSHRSSGHDDRRDWEPTAHPATRPPTLPRHRHVQALWLGRGAHGRRLRGPRRRGRRPRRRQRRGQVDAHQGDRGRPARRPRDDRVDGERVSIRSASDATPRDRDRLSGPRPVRQPRRRREPLPGRRDADRDAPHLDEYAMERKTIELLDSLA